MPFSRQLPLNALIELCRTLRHSLGAGLSVVDVFRGRAGRGAAALRPLAGRVGDRLASGDSLTDALAQEGDALPPLFRAMAEAGEQSGNLPEVFAQLERYYELQQKLGREFRGRLIFQLVQLGIAFVIIAVVLFVLGSLAGGGGPAVLGVRGGGAAFLFLLLSFGTVALAFVGYHVLRRSLRRRAGVDRLWLRLPLIGPCVEALALGRFAMALRMTLDSRLPIKKAIRLSFAATGNGAFAARADEVVEAVKSGEGLTEALGRAGVFPAEFLQIVAVGEEGGRVPEVMEHQFTYYQEEAERRLKLLTRAAAGLVWLLYAAFMIIAIFKIAGMAFGQRGL